MIWLIKKRLDKLVDIMREGIGRDKPLKKIDGDNWQLFKELPQGFDVTDPYFQVQEFDTPQAAIDWLDENKASMVNNDDKVGLKPGAPKGKNPKA